MKKLFTCIVLVLSLLIVSAGCGSKSSGIGNSNTEKVLTMSELKKYNGQNGNPAYIAVDGVIYDVSTSPLWKNGNHKGYEAGNDLTKEIKESSPHGTDVLKKFPIVGNLKD